MGRESEGLSWWFSSKKTACQHGRHRRCGLDPRVGKIAWRKKWQPTPIFLPGKSHGQRSLAGYSPWGCKVGHRLATKQQQQRIWSGIFPKKAYRWPMGENVLNITKHQGNANQNHMRYHLTLARMTINKKTKDDKCWQGCGEKRTHFYCCWKCKLVQTSMENIMEVPQKIKSRAVVWSSSFHFWVYIQRKWNYYLKEISTLLCSLQHYLLIQQPRHRNNLSVHWLMNRYRKCGI